MSGAKFKLLPGLCLFGIAALNAPAFAQSSVQLNGLVDECRLRKKPRHPRCGGESRGRPLDVFLGISRYRGPGRRLFHILRA